MDRRVRAGSTLHERDEELALIDAVLDSAARGGGQLALFEGSPGVGKSALLAEAAARADRLGMRALVVGGREKERPIPHGVSRRLLEPLLAELSADERAEVFIGAAVLAQPLFDASSQGDGGDSLDHGLSSLHGLHWLCANLAEDRPLLLAVDDAHWSDPASIRFLGHLLPRLEALPAAVLVAARPDAVHRVGVPFQQVRSHPATHRVKLAPLSKETCRTIFISMGGSDLDEEQCERYWNITQGNPYLLEQVLTAHKEGGPEEVGSIIDQVTGAGDGLAVAMTRRRLAGATDEERAFALMVAVLGPAANVERCAELAGLQRSGADEAFERLVESGILEPSQPIDFTHPLVADAMVERLSAEELESLHRRAAQLLHDEGAGAELVASFVLLTDPVGEQWAVDALKDAARRASLVGAHDSATLHLRRLLKEDLSDLERGRALTDLGRAEAFVEPERALGHLRESLRYFEAPEQRAEIYRLTGHQLHSVGRNEEAVELFEEAIEELGDLDPELTFQLRLDRVGVAKFVVDKRDEALVELDELAERASPGVPAAHQLYTEMALTEVRKGRSCEAAAEALRHALPDLDTRPDQAIVDSLLPLHLYCLSWTDQLELASKLRTAALAEARRRGSLMLFATVGCFGALGAYQEGSVSECAALAQQAIDAIPDGWARGIPIACTIAAYAHMERGELNDAEQVLDIGFGHEGTEGSIQIPFLFEARARLALTWGTPESAIDDLERAGRFMTQTMKATNPAILGWRSRLARAYSATDQRDRALEVIDEEIELATRFGANRPVASAYRTKGFILGADGVGYLEEALSMIEDSPARLERAGCQITLGRNLRLAGDVRSAREILNAGLREAVLCGSAMLENVARSELTAAGARPRRRAVTGVASLTPGERRVIELAAQGRTNKEIAEALFVTVKAVEWHLSNAYRKLGVATRAGLKDLDLNPHPS